MALMPVDICVLGTSLKRTGRPVSAENPLSIRSRSSTAQICVPPYHTSIGSPSASPAPAETAL